MSKIYAVTYQYGYFRKNKGISVGTKLDRISVGGKIWAAPIDNFFMVQKKSDTHRSVAGENL